MTMHAAILVDSTRAAIRGLVHDPAEAAMRLTPVLPGETNRLVRPEDSHRHARIEYAASTSFWQRRAQRLAITRLLEQVGPDLLVACGRDVWKLAEAAARALEIPLAIEIWSHDEARRVPRGSAAYLAGTQGLAALLRSRIPAEHIAIAPIGIDIPDDPPSFTLLPEHILGIAALGRCRSLPVYRALLAALRALTDEGVSMQVVLEIDGPREHAVWREVRRLGLSDRITALDHADAQHLLIAQCDVVIFAESAGEARPLMLESIARCGAIVAAEDPALDILSPERALIVKKTTQMNGWRKALRALLDDPDAATRRAENAWGRLRERHRHEHALAERRAVFHRMLSGETLRFDPTHKS